MCTAGAVPAAMSLPRRFLCPRWQAASLAPASSPSRCLLPAVGSQGVAAGGLYKGRTAAGAEETPGAAGAFPPSLHVIQLPPARGAEGKPRCKYPNRAGLCRAPRALQEGPHTRPVRTGGQWRGEPQSVPQSCRSSACCCCSAQPPGPSTSPRQGWGGEAMGLPGLPAAAARSLCLALRD